VIIGKTNHLVTPENLHRLRNKLAADQNFMALLAILESFTRRKKTIVNVVMLLRSSISGSMRSVRSWK
jgi:1,2-phenylacetyl-CoA epoxidase PaaB subunit